MNWIYEKIKGDMGIYAICPKCSFVHGCGQVDFKTGKIVIDDQYAFCPLCGTFLYSENDNPDITYNVRDMIEKFNIKYDITVIEHAINEARKYDTEQGD